LRPKPKKLSQWFWGQTTDKWSLLVLRLNRKTHASRLLHMYDVDCTQRQLTSLSFDYWVPDLYLIIHDPPHHVSYSWLNPRRCLSCPFATYTPQDKQTCFSTPNNSIWVSSTKMCQIQIQTRTSQLLITLINQGTNHLVSQIYIFPNYICWFFTF
jgi:hypothetical protein